LTFSSKINVINQVVNNTTNLLPVLTTTQLVGGILQIPEAVPIASDGSSPPTTSHMLRRKTGGKKKAPTNLSRVESSRIGISPFAMFDSINSSFTVSFWFKASQQAVNHDFASIFSYGNFRKGSGIGVGLLRGGVIYCGIGSGISPLRASNIPVAISADAFVDNAYHYVSCIFNNNMQTLTLLVDGNTINLFQPVPFTGGKLVEQGVLDISSLYPIAITSNNSPIVIGSAIDMINDGFDGEISELRFWNTPRTKYQEAEDMWIPMQVATDTLLLCLPLNDCQNVLPLTSGFTYLNGTHQPLQIIYNTQTIHFPSCGFHFHPLVSLTEN